MAPSANDNIHTCLLISDFTIENFSGFLVNDETEPFVKTRIAPYDQVMPILMNESMDVWQPKPDSVLVWTRPEKISEAFQKLSEYQSQDEKCVMQDVDDFTDLLLGAKDRANTFFIPTWVIPSTQRGMGVLDLKHKNAHRLMLAKMNLRLVENLRNEAQFFVFDTERWVSLAGKNAMNPKIWYMAKIAFGNAVYPPAIKDIKAAIRAISGQTRKILILDLDDTLWGGIVGEVGWEKIVLGGHDGLGEAFLDFQKAICSLKQRGIILGIVSKNDEKTALEVLEKHPEMHLKKDDFIAWRINWKDKAENVIDLLKEINLGAQSAVFIDNSPQERDRVHQAVPEIYVPEWPSDPAFYKSVLLSLDCFDSVALSEEDAQRTELYAQERKRKDLQRQIPSMDDWLKSLEMKIHVTSIDESCFDRALQLLNKTNQMNMRTRRLDEADFRKWMKGSGHKIWSFRVKDKFGDAGITGLVSMAAMHDKAVIVDFVMSCRVMGRHVEDAMVHVICEYAKANNICQIEACYQPTSKNHVCLSFWEQSGFQSVNGKTSDRNTQTFVWDTDKTYPTPSYIEIIQKD